MLTKNGKIMLFKSILLYRTSWYMIKMAMANIGSETNSGRRVRTPNVGLKFDILFFTADPSASEDKTDKIMFSNV
jgi:hypothetical protein